MNIHLVEIQILEELCVLSRSFQFGYQIIMIHQVEGETWIKEKTSYYIFILKEVKLR